MAAGPRRASLVVLRCLTALAALAFALLGAEIAIRLFPELLGERARHAAFSRHDTLPGGIFVVEGITGARFMRADAETRAYSAGRFWSHRTDGRGFRNPPGIAAADVVLLGDSLIYGHGVAADQTVSHFLRIDHDVAAYDMSAQGRCPYEHYLSFRLWGADLRPTTALLFVYVNDLRDLAKLGRTRLLPHPPEIDGVDYQEIRTRVDTLIHHREPLVLRALYVSNLVRMASKTWGWRPNPPPESSTLKQWRVPRENPNSEPAETSVPEAVLDDGLFRPAERYLDLLIGDLALRTSHAGTRLIVVHLVPPVDKPWPARDRAQAKLQQSLDGICRRHGLELADTAAFFDGHLEWILPDDGHLNEEGHRALARFLATSVLDPE
ncbi:MAG: SGNH/GDSL hydrolase family protein [Thermoanaerobaculales bacterium]|nr:SGNH/GDSL hydrolase family protein [Thermoanaerobaculales bacterium]